jgi:hypothetical protein
MILFVKFGERLDHPPATASYPVLTYYDASVSFKNIVFILD